MRWVVVTPSRATIWIGEVVDSEVRVMIAMKVKQTLGMIAVFAQSCSSHASKQLVLDSDVGDLQLIRGVAHHDVTASKFRDVELCSGIL